MAALFAADATNLRCEYLTEPLGVDAVKPRLSWIINSDHRGEKQTATVHVPTKNAASVTESGKPVSSADSVKFLRMENGAAVYEVGSGSFRFGSEYL